MAISIRVTQEEMNKITAVVESFTNYVLISTLLKPGESLQINVKD